MDVDEFVHWWQGRDRYDLVLIAEAIRAARESVDGELCWRRSTKELCAVARRSGRQRQAGEAVHRVGLAARRACEVAGMSASDPARVTLLTRAAGDAALGLVRGQDSAPTATVLRPFLGAMVLASS